MKNKKRLIKNNGYYTSFETPLEIENYMSILGAEFIKDDTFILDGLKCGVDYEYRGIWFEHGFSPEVLSLFKEYGIYTYGSVLFSLEGLVLLHTMRIGDNIEESYAENFNNARRAMLQRVLDKRVQLDFNEPLNKFDNATVPFLSNNFDPEAFLDKCVFNTTGYYTKEGYNRCLIFKWRVKKDPMAIYEITTYYSGYRSTILLNSPFKRNHQQVYHTVNSFGEKIQYFNDGFSIEYDKYNQKITEYADFKSHTQYATEFDEIKMASIANSLVDEKLSFEKSVKKRKTR